MTWNLSNRIAACGAGDALRPKRNVLGDIALARSDHDAARKAYDDALTLYRQIGDVRGEANCLEKLEKLKRFR
jgi:hypothetical protein